MTVNFGMANPYMYNMDADTIMNAPILNANTAMGGMGYGYGMAGMTTPYTGVGTFGNVLNPQYQMRTMQQWDNFGISRQVAQYQNQNNAQFQMASQTENISRQIQILRTEIQNNNQDNVKAEYNKLLAAVKASYGSQIASGVSPEEAEAQVKAYAERLYAQQTGSYITDDIKNNSSSSFWSGVKQILTFGFGNKTTADENISMINGTKQTTASKASKVAGNIVGGLFGGLLAVGSFLLLKGKKA